MGDDQLSVPMLEMDDATSWKHLQLLFERNVYLLKRIADEPALFMDGRHHQDARGAIEALEKRLKAAGGWKSLLNGPDKPNDPPKSIPHEALEVHGLLAKEFSLKYHAFDQQFQSFLDRMAELANRNQFLKAKLDQIEAQEFAKKVRSPGKIAQAALEIAQPIVGSAAEAIPGAKEILGALKEIGKVFGGLIQAKRR
jgi:hypothetical protein